MRDVVLLVLGAIAGVGATESYSHIKARIARIRLQRLQTEQRRRDDSPRHAANIVEIYRAATLDGMLYTTQTGAVPRKLPLLFDVSVRISGRLEASRDWPLVVDDRPRAELCVDEADVSQLRQQGVELWDGTVLYSLGWDASADALRVARCNYFAYVTMGARVLRESDSSQGQKKYLGRSTPTFDAALTSPEGPAVVAAAVTCVFDTESGPVTIVHKRSATVVNARGMYAVTPVHSVEPHQWGGETSAFGAVVYNVLKEMLEEFFGEEDIRFNNDQARAMHPDWIFESDNGRALLDEIASGRLELYSNGACADLSDGSVILAISAHFKSSDFLRRLKMLARGSVEAEWQEGVRFRLVSLFGGEIDGLAQPDKMISSSHFSLDRARLRVSGALSA